MFASGGTSRNNSVGSKCKNECQGMDTGDQIIDVIGYLLKGDAYHAASTADRADQLVGLWGLGW